MRMRSTYVALLLGISAAAALVVTSCSPEPTAPKRTALPRDAAQKVEDLRNGYAWMGDYHTGALADIYVRLSAKENRGLSKVAKCRVAMAELKEFHKSFRRNGRPLAFSDLSTVDGFCDAATRGDFKVVATLSAPPSATRRTELSTTARGYFSALERAVDVPTRSQADAGVAAVEAAAAQNLFGDEAGAVVGLASIAYSSTAYWDANYAAWRQNDGYAAATVFGAGGPQMNVQSIGGSPRRSMDAGPSIWKIDLAAAITTLLYEWWLGTIALEKAAIRGAAASAVAILFG